MDQQQHQEESCGSVEGLAVPGTVTATTATMTVSQHQDPSSTVSIGSKRSRTGLKQRQRDKKKKKLENEQLPYDNNDNNSGQSPSSSEGDYSQIEPKKNDEHDHDLGPLLLQKKSDDPEHLHDNDPNNPIPMEPLLPDPVPGAQPQVKRTNGRGYWAVPKDWLGCPKISTSLIGGKFVSFKTPLRSEKYDMKLDKEEQWHIEHVLSHTESMFQKSLGLWIDLTFTEKYFDKSIILGKGVEYSKFKIEGKGTQPPRHVVQEFIRTCDEFIKRNPDYLIGVHCTHGHNRTGYLIVSYLAECMGYPIQDAIEEFRISKPPGIYRQNYVDLLFEKYKSRSNLSLPPLVTIPSWTEGSDHDNSEPKPEKRHTENVELRKPLDEAISNISGPLFFGSKTLSGAIPVTPIVRTLILNDIAEILELPDYRFLSKPGKFLSKENIKLLNPDKYKVSWITKSTRYLMWIKCYEGVYFIDSLGSVFQVPNLTFPSLENVGSHYHLVNTLCIGEMTTFNISNSQIPTLVIQDVLLFNGQKVHSEPFYRRAAIVKNEILQPRILAKQGGFISRTRESKLHLRYKPFYNLEEAKRLLDGTIRSGLYSPPHGLVFVARDQPYSFSQDDNTIFYWKKSMSVDFRWRPNNTTISTNLYISEYEQPFTSIKILLGPLRSEISEFKYDRSISAWVFCQPKDSSVPSSVEDANEAISAPLGDPLSQDQLLSLIENQSIKQSNLFIRY